MIVAFAGNTPNICLEKGEKLRTEQQIRLFFAAGALLAFFALVVAPQAVAQQTKPPAADQAPQSAPDEADEPTANPGRPTVSTPAALTPVGYLQFETGFLGARHAPGIDSQYSMNEVMKLAITPRVEFLVSAEPVAHSRESGIAGGTPNDAGDVSLGAQMVLRRGEGAKPTLAASVFHRFYSGEAPDLDITSSSNSLLLLASADVRKFHYDANVFFSEVEDPPVRRAQFGWSLSVSHALPRNFSVSGEVWQFTQPFLHSQAAGTLWAAGYAARKTLVFDAGFDRGLTETSTRWEFFCGFTYLLPHRLWDKRQSVK